jgi:hypothetical protein
MLMRCKIFTALLVVLIVLAFAPLSRGAEPIKLTYANYSPPSRCGIGRAVLRGG